MSDHHKDLCELRPWLPPRSCAAGWHGLHARPSEGLACLLPPKLLATLVEAAEERGRLRIGVQQTGRFDAQIAALIRKAEEASEGTCQQCGALGSRAERGRWWATLCEEHEQQGMWL